MPKFQDIPQFMPNTVEFDVGWDYLEQWLSNHSTQGFPTVNLDPPWQREHVWTEAQQIAFIEFCLRGGTSGRNVYINCSTWHGKGYSNSIDLVDGKQRLTAVRQFMAGNIPAFGFRLHEYDDRVPPMDRATSLRFHIAELQSDAEVIQWYLDLNYAGTPHTTEELERVRKLLEDAGGP